MSQCVERLLADNNGLVVRTRQPKVDKAIDRAVRSGALTRLAPGVYCDTGRREDLGLRIRAVCATEPTAVITGAAAAAVLWWPELAVPVVEATHPIRVKRSGPGIRWHRDHVPDELIVEKEGARIAAPALATLDLIPELGGQAIDEALRRKAATLADLGQALTLTPGRGGNQHRAHLLRDSRDEPWSEAERFLQATVRGLVLPCRYATNYPAELPNGTTHPIDLALPDLLLGLEADGYEFHHSRRAFVRDREIPFDLATVGWQIVRIAAEAVTDDPDLAGKLQAIIDGRAELFAALSPSVRQILVQRATERADRPPWQSGAC